MNQAYSRIFLNSRILARREKTKKRKFSSRRRNKWRCAIAACHSLNPRSIEKKRPIAYGNNLDWHVSRFCYSRHRRSILLPQFRPSPSSKAKWLASARVILIPAGFDKLICRETMTASPCLTATMRRMECVQSSARAGTCILSAFQLYTPKHPTMFGYPSPPPALSVAF